MAAAGDNKDAYGCGRGSAVVGYMRSALSDDPKFADWDAHIRAYAADRGYNLIDIIRDQSNAVASWRPTIDRLMQDLKAGRYVGVIIPDVQHLGMPASRANRILEDLRSTSAWVACIVE